MARAAAIQSSFFYGELSPLMAGRVELDEYKQGLDLCQGYIPLVQGGLTACPGTQHISIVKDSNLQTWLASFTFSTDQAYIIEAGSFYFRFYRNDERIDVTPGVAAEVITPYPVDAVPNLKITQSADVLYIFHPSYAPTKLVRTSHTQWTLTYIDFRDGPYLPVNTTLTTLTPQGDGTTAVPTTWTEVANPKNVGINAIVWNGVYFVGVGNADGTDAYILGGSDLSNVTEIANPKNVALRSVMWNGAMFVAVGDADGTDAYILSSVDGSTVTEHANPQNTRLNGVAQKAGLFCAVGNTVGGAAYILTTTDGTDISQKVNPKNTALRGIAANSTIFCAVGDADGGDAYIVTSADGTTWTERANPKNIGLKAVIWIGTMFVAVGDADGTDAYIVTSPDGVVWTERANPKNIGLRAVMWSGTVAVAVGAPDGIDAYMLTTQDGITITERANPKNFGLNAVAWNGTVFLAAGDPDGTDAYIVSSSPQFGLLASGAVFVSTDVGRLVRIKHGGTWGYAKIISYTSPTLVGITTMSAFGAATASTFWRLGAWSATTGYPRAVAFYEDRLWGAGAPQAPQRIDGSKSGDYENFAPSGTDGVVSADNAISVTLASREVNVVHWLIDDERALIAGTPGGPWAIKASTAGEALSPTNISAKRISSYGCAAIPPVYLGDSVAYVQRDLRKLRTLIAGSDIQDGFSIPDLTLLSEHITRGGLGQMAVQLSPQPVLWSPRGDGTLLGMTFIPVGSSGKIAVGWHRHVRGGHFGTGITEHANPKNFDLYAIAQKGGLFCAVGAADGADAYVVTTPDGVVVTERVNPKNFALRGITSNSTLFVAVGDADGTDAYIITSPDGTTWTERANPKNKGLRSVTWSGAQFVAVGDADGTDAYILTSPDGVTWTERANPKNFALNTVVYGGGVYVAGGEPDGVDAYVVTSANGITWTEVANPKNAAIYGSAWNGTVFVGVGAADGVNAYVISSPDGAAVQEHTNPKNVALRSVVWNGYFFVAVGDPDGTDAYVGASLDGVTVTEVANPKNIGLNAVMWNGTMFIAVGDADGTDAYAVSGSSLSGQAVVESVAVIPSTDGTRDQLWMVVRRTVNGATQRAVEIMRKIFDEGDHVTDAFFVDSGKTYQGPSVTVITGLSHLEGETVAVLADGAVHPDRVVTGGQITLERAATKVQVGLPFDAKGRTLRFDAGAQNGTSQGKIQRITQAAFRLQSTAAMKAGPTFEALDEVVFRTSADPTNTPVPAYTGDKPIVWDGDYSTEARICWKRDKPMPSTVLAVMVQLATEDKN